MNFIAVDLKVIETHAPALSRALGLDLPATVGALTLLWHRCWVAKTDRIGTLELRGFFAHPEAAALMAAFGFLEPGGDSTWRVKGAERYLRITEQRRRAGAARAAGATRSAGRFAGPDTSGAPADDQRTTSGEPALSPNTEHRTPIELQQPVEQARLVDVPPTPEPPKTLEDKLTDAEYQVFEHWRQTLNHPKAKATPERKRIIARALKTYSVEECQRAITGCSRSPHHMGQNDRRTRYDDLELILRDAKHIEGFLRFVGEAA